MNGHNDVPSTLVATATARVLDLTSPERLMTVTVPEREALARQRVHATSEGVMSQLAQHETAASVAFALATDRLRDAQQGMNVTQEERSRNLSLYSALCSQQQQTNAQPTILHSLLMLFTVFPDPTANDDALCALTTIDWGASDAVSCATVYRALTDYVDGSTLSTDAARAVGRTKLFLAIRSGSLRLLSDFLCSPSAQQVTFPKGLSLAALSTFAKAPKVTLQVADLALRVGPALFSSSRTQQVSCFPLNSSVALIAKSRLLVLDSAPATPSVYSLKGQAPFPALHAGEYPIYMSDSVALTIRCTSKSMYDQQFVLRVHRLRGEQEEALVHLTVSTRGAPLVSSAECRFSFNERHLSCLFFASSRNAQHGLHVLRSPLNIDTLPAVSQLQLGCSGGGGGALLQRLSAVCSRDAMSPYLALSFTKGYTVSVGEVTILDHFQPFCVELWVFLRHVEEPQTLVTIGDKSADEVVIEVEPATDGVAWKGGLRSTFLGASFARYVGPEAYTAVNTWTHVALNFTGTTWELSLDHRVVALGKARVRPDPIIGAKCRLGGNLSGFLAEVRVWNCHRDPTALRRDAYRGLRGDENLLCGYFPLNEGGGDVAADYTHKAAHALLSTGISNSASCWSPVPPPPISSFVTTRDDAGGWVPQPRCIADILPLVVAESSEDVLFTTTASSFVIACRRHDTVHVYQYNMASSLLALEYAVTVPKTWALLDVRGNVTTNTVLCCAADIGPRTSLQFWELQCQGPVMPGAADAPPAHTAWQVGSSVLHYLAYYAERMIPLELPPRFPAWASMTFTKPTTTTHATPWPGLLVDGGGDEVISSLLRLATVAAATRQTQDDATPVATRDGTTPVATRDGTTTTNTTARDVCSILSVNLLLYCESSRPRGEDDRRSPRITPFATVEEMLHVMDNADDPDALSPLGHAGGSGVGCAAPKIATQTRDDLARLAVQPFALETSLLQTCCQCFLSWQSTLAFIRKLSGKARTTREDTVMGCLIDSLATLPAAHDLLLKRGNDGQVVFDALVLDTLAVTQTTTAAEPRESFNKGVRCLTVVMEVLLARCAAVVADDGSSTASTGASVTAAATATKVPSKITKPSSPPIVTLGEHCCKSLLKASRHVIEWAAQRVREQPDEGPLMARQLRRCHVGTLLPWLLLTLPQMPTQITKASLPLVHGCREALHTFAESLPHREARKARWLAELRLILLHSEGLTASLLTVGGLRAPAAANSSSAASSSPSPSALGSSPEDSTTAEADDAPLDTQKLMPLLMGGLRKSGTERDLLIKNLKHGVGPISKVVDELQRADMSALRIMRDEATRKMEWQIMAAFCALCVSTSDLASASKAALQPIYRHVVALRPWILAKRQQAKGFAHEVASRAHFLAMFELCCTPAAAGAMTGAQAHTIASSPTTALTPKRGGKYPHTIDSTRRRWRKLFQTWRAARLVATMQTTHAEGDSADRFIDIKDVLRSNATPEQLMQIVSTRVHLAHERLSGLLGLRELLVEARTAPPIASTLLPLVAQHLCRWHYAHGVECCSAEDRFRLQEAFLQLVDVTVDGFNDTHDDTGAVTPPAASVRGDAWGTLFVSLLTCDFCGADLRRLRGAAFTKAMNTLCNGIATAAATPSAEGGVATLTGDDESLSAFVRPATISLSKSGMPLFTASAGSLGTAVGPFSCLSVAPADRSRTSPRSYFEIHLLSTVRASAAIAIGLGPSDYSVSSFPGFDPGSCALRLTDGGLFTGLKTTGKQTGCTFDVGDTVGCGVSSDKKSVFWTRNGLVIATVPIDETEASLPRWHPLIGLGGSATVMVNLGNDPFMASDSVIVGESTPPKKKRSGRVPPLPLIANNRHWQAFCVFSLNCALILAQQQTGSAEAALGPLSSPSPSAPPSPTAGSAPSSSSAAVRANHLVQIMGLCFAQLVSLLDRLRVLLFATTSTRSGDESVASKTSPPPPPPPLDRTMRNMLTLLQHTQTIALLLAELDSAHVTALAPHVTPLTKRLHQLVTSVLSIPCSARDGRDGDVPAPSIPYPSTPSVFQVPASLGRRVSRLVTSAMLSYYLVTHLNPPPLVAIPCGGKPSSTPTTPTRDMTGTHDRDDSVVGVGGGDAMLTVLLQLAGRVCIASSELGVLGAPPSPHPRKRASSTQQTQSVETSAGMGELGQSPGTDRSSVAAVDVTGTEAAEQAVWMALALLQRMIAGPSSTHTTHSWQPVLRDWLLSCLDRPHTPGHDVLLTLTVLQYAPRMPVAGDVVPVTTSSKRETCVTLQWLSLEDDICEVLDDDGCLCYLPLRAVDAIQVDDSRNDFPQPNCAMHLTLAHKLLLLCKRLWPTGAAPTATELVSLEHQAMRTAALSLLARCAARNVLTLPPPMVRIAVSLACSADLDGDSEVPQRNRSLLRLLKLLTETWCAGLMQTNRMRRRSLSTTATNTSLLTPFRLMQSVTSPVPMAASTTHPYPMLLTTATAASTAATTTTTTPTTTTTMPFIPYAMRSSTRSMTTRTTTTTTATLRPWDFGHPRAPLDVTTTPFRNRQYSDGGDDDGGFGSESEEDVNREDDDDDDMDEEEVQDIGESENAETLTDLERDVLRQQQQTDLFRDEMPLSPSSSVSVGNDNQDLMDEFFFMDEYEPGLPPFSARDLDRLRELDLPVVDLQNPESQRLMQQWITQDTACALLAGPGGGGSEDYDETPSTTTTATAPQDSSPTRSAQLPLRISTGIHFEHSCLCLVAHRDVGQYYTIDLHLRVRHLDGHQIIFVQLTSTTRTPSAGVIARIWRGHVEFGWVAALPGADDATTSLGDVCRCPLGESDVGHWLRLTFVQVGRVVSIFRDGVLRTHLRMRRHVSPLLREPFFLGGIPQDPRSSLEGCIGDFCIYDLALRPTVIDQFTRHPPSQLHTFVELHLAVRLQVRETSFVNTAPPPAAVLLDIVADGEVGNSEDAAANARSPISLSTDGGGADGGGGVAPGPCAAPVDEADFGSDGELTDKPPLTELLLYRLGDAWRQRQQFILDHLTSSYRAYLRQLMLQYATRLTLDLLVHALHSAHTSSRSSDTEAGTVVATDDDALQVLAEMGDKPEVLQSLVHHILQGSDPTLHGLLATATNGIFELGAARGRREVGSCVDHTSTTTTTTTTITSVAAGLLQSLLHIAATPEKRADFESNHPIRSVVTARIDVTPTVAHEGECFHVYFDPRCSSSEGSYTFASDASLSTVIYSVRSHALEDFRIVMGGLFAGIRADVNTAPQWGYKLAVVWQSDAQRTVARLLRTHVRTTARLSESSLLDQFRLLERCAMVNTGKTRRLALASLTELLVLTPPSPFPRDLLTSLHALHLMAERLCCVGRRNTHAVHRVRFAQLAMECYLLYTDTYLCFREGANAAHGTTPAAEAVSLEEEQAAYQSQRQQRRLLYEAREDERVGLVTSDVTPNMTLEWTAHHVWLVRSDKGPSSLVTNVALSSGCWYYEVKMAGGGNVFLGVYAVPSAPTTTAGDAPRPHRAPTQYALNGLAGVLRRCPRGGHVEDTVLSSAKVWSGKDTVGVVVDIPQRVCRFFVNGVDVGVSFSFATNTEAAATAAAAPEEAGTTEQDTAGETAEEAGCDDEASNMAFRLFLALDHGEMVHVNFGGSAFDYAIPRFCFPVDPAHLGEAMTLPYHQLRAFQDMALHFLLPTHAHRMPLFLSERFEPFHDSPDREGPPNVSLHAPDAVTVHELSAMNTDTAFRTVYANCAVRGGRWYYEVSVRTQGLMQIGWAVRQSEAPALPTGEGGCGVGDTAASWSVDGFRLVKWHGGTASGLTTPRRWSPGDVVGCALDLVRGTMLFTLNGRPLVGYAGDSPSNWTATGPRLPITSPAPFTFEQLPSGGLYVPCVSLRAGNRVTFNFGSSPLRFKPDGFNALGMPDTWTERIETYYTHEPLAMVHRRLDGIRQFCEAAPGNPKASNESSSSGSNLDEYIEMVKFVDDLCASNDMGYNQVNDKTIRSAVEEAFNRPDGKADDSTVQLTGTVNTAHLRLSKLVYLTRILKSVFPFLAFGDGGANVSTRLFLALRPILVRSWRFEMADTLLRESNVRAESVRLSINRAMARSSAALQGGHRAFLRTVFGQTFLILRKKSPRLFRTNKRLWHTTFIGEGAEDVGGPYREHLTEMCTELMSSRLPFFVASPNNHQNLGTHRDAYVPAAGAVSPRAFDVFNFVGRLMGSAMRSGEPLSLSFPPLVWAGLSGASLTEADLQTVDLTCGQCVKEFRHLATQGATEPEVVDDVLDSASFITQLCDGTTCELIPGGAAVRVTAARLAEYAEALLQARLHEFDQQIAHMRLGLLAVVPEAVLALLSPAELERKVCGQPDIAVEELRKGVMYEGLTSEDRRVALLWQALEEATPKQRRLFLRFASGRDRLPVRLRLVALPTTGDPDHSLVKAATCFFAVEIPDYSCLEVMKRKLYYSIENCVDMDTDYFARPTNNEERPRLDTAPDPGDLLDDLGISMSESNLSMF